MAGAQIVPKNRPLDRKEKREECVLSAHADDGDVREEDIGQSGGDGSSGSDGDGGHGRVRYVCGNDNGGGIGRGRRICGVTAPGEPQTRTVVATSVATTAAAAARTAAAAAAAAMTAATMPAATTVATWCSLGVDYMSIS